MDIGGAARIFRTDIVDSADITSSFYCNSKGSSSVVESSGTWDSLASKSCASSLGTSLAGSGISGPRVYGPGAGALGERGCGPEEAPEGGVVGGAGLPGSGKSAAA
jgi:hypothetical protein